jgi:excisionase family DNA binding protein
MHSSTLLTPQQVADQLGVTLHTLAVWRCEQRYPLKYVKVGRLVRYQESEVERFILTRTNTGVPPSE